MRGGRGDRLNFILLREKRGGNFVLLAVHQACYYYYYCCYHCIGQLFEIGTYDTHQHTRGISVTVGGEGEDIMARRETRERRIEAKLLACKR